MSNTYKDFVVLFNNIVFYTLETASSSVIKVESNKFRLANTNSETKLNFIERHLANGESSIIKWKLLKRSRKTKKPSENLSDRSICHLDSNVGMSHWLSDSELSTFSPVDKNEVFACTKIQRSVSLEKL